ncbi:sensor histidine kinase [Terrisporobacter glycolicus]|uniref:histidine kinase n=1 Tax=Terrisporobacter glycolicus ATCC 14880 = DSM 1288 TaxID=1121315 RepID=A0ABZ2ERC7_9FIRM|nr:HAMP domain-containing sensor histidine kinase [Terrisporobacter glycolicus]
MDIKLIKHKKERSLEIQILIVMTSIFFTLLFLRRIMSIPFLILTIIEVFELVNILRKCKSKNDILNKSIIFKVLFDKNVNLDNKLILIKAITIFIVFIIVQVIVASGLNYVKIDYYTVMDNIFPDLNLYRGNNFISALIGIIFCDLIMGLFIIKKLNKLVDIQFGVSQLKKGNFDYKIDTTKDDMIGKLAMDINNLGYNMSLEVEERLKSERMKTDLITNVSHDLKTPLTAIINYIELIKKENTDLVLKDYVEVLDKRSQRLKVLIEDLFEASKVSSNDLELNLEKNDINQLLMQSIVEMDEAIENSQLDFIVNVPEKEVYILADGRKTFRVFENLIYNILKYSLEGTRVYIDLTIKENKINICLKNISKYPLNFDANEITDRFTRGDLSRNIEGSGLGLAIAKGLVEAQGGIFEIDILGDLFIATIEFDLINEQKE